MSLTKRLVQFSQDIGFDLIGITPVTPSAQQSLYRDWVQKGYAGEMGYLQRNIAKRINPSLTAPGARSVISVAMNYYTAPEIPEDGEIRGWVSRYAWGDDYHHILEARLFQLRSFLRAEDSTEQRNGERVYVDTGPVLEREIAARGGIGWQGKNTNLLSRSIGSWFFLGEVFTKTEFEYTGPTTAHCGSCTKCLVACPTRAFVGPYVLDARRCISYLTIELKGSIPRELRPLMGNHIFGCDICQEVCPWNRKVKPTTEKAFSPRPDLVAPPLLPLMNLSEEEFRERFRRSPIKRAKRRGLLRNVAVALGNSKNPRAIPALANALHDPEPLIREHAAWALGQIGGIEAKRLLEQNRGRETEPAVRMEIEQTLAEMS